MRTARNQPDVEEMMDSVGIRISVRGMMPAIMARRVSSVTRRSTGPITKPMNRSMPVHSAPVMTWTKSRTQRLGERIAAIIAAKATVAATIYQGRSGAATRAGGATIIVSAKRRSRCRTAARLATESRNAKTRVPRARPRCSVHFGLFRGLLRGAEFCRRSLPAQLIEHEDADRRGQVIALPPLGDLSHDCRQLRLLRAGDLAQALPKFVFERHAGLLPVADDRAFDVDGVHGLSNGYSRRGTAVPTL